MFFYIIITIVCVLYYYFTRTLTYWKRKNVKGPKPIPLFGNFKDVALRRKPKFLLYHEIYKRYPKEKVVGVYQMTSPGLLIRDLDIVKQILIKDFELFPDRGTYFSKRGFGENMIHCDGDTWKNLRNRFTSIFTLSKFKNKFHLLVDRGDQLINYVRNVIEKQPEQDTFKLMFTYGVSTSIATTFGWDVDTFTEKPCWFTVLDDHFINSHWYEIDLLFPNLLMNFGLSITTKETIKICKQILKTCLNQQSVSSEMNISNVKDVLITLKKDNTESKQVNNERGPIIEMTDDLLASQVWVFHIAGYINNTLSMTYALYYLARNQTIQAKLRNEIDDIMGKCEGKMTYELIKEMKYLKMVFDETLRMHPTSHVITRSVKQNTKLDGTNLVIAKGTTVIISPYSIQHDEKYYPDPEVFNPERFSPDNIRYEHPCVFLSFGAGRRGCLATQWARLQFGVGLTKLIYNFLVETTENTCSSLTYDPYHMLIKPKPGVRLKFINREKSF